MKGRERGEEIGALVGTNEGGQREN